MIGDKIKKAVRHKCAGYGLSALFSTEIIMLMWESRRISKQRSIP